MPHHTPESSRWRPTRLHTACLGLGSNVAPAANLRMALQRLRRLVTVEAVSSSWESPAVEALAEAPDYVNAAVIIQTTFDRAELLVQLKQIESSLGRSRGRRQTLVGIDIDLLVYDGQVVRSDLWELAYRAVPVAELLPALALPETGEPLTVAADRHLAAGMIRPRPDILLDAARPLASQAASGGRD